MTKVMLRRAHLRLDVTTAHGERKTVPLDVRPGEVELSGALLAVIVSSLAAHDMQLVDELEQPLSGEALRPLESALTAPVPVAAVILPDQTSPSASAVASPSVAVASTGETSPVVKSRRAFGNAQRPAAPPTKHVVRDAHRRIEPTRGPLADVVIGPRDTPAVGHHALRVGSAIVVGQQHAQSAVVIRPEAPGPLPPVYQSGVQYAPDMTAPPVAKPRRGQ